MTNNKSQAERNLQQQTKSEMVQVMSQRESACLNSMRISVNIDTSGGQAIMKALKAVDVKKCLP